MNLPVMRRPRSLTPPSNSTVGLDHDKFHCPGTPWQPSFPDAPIEGISFLTLIPVCVNKSSCISSLNDPDNHSILNIYNLGRYVPPKMGVSRSASKAPLTNKQKGDEGGGRGHQTSTAAQNGAAYPPTARAQQ